MEDIPNFITRQKTVQKKWPSSKFVLGIILNIAIG
jgi:hypothetical protein